jgi:hypothetical protein
MTKQSDREAEVVRLFIQRNTQTQDLTLSHDKRTQQSKTRRNFFNLTKGIYENSHLCHT